MKLKGIGVVVGGAMLLAVLIVLVYLIVNVGYTAANVVKDYTSTYEKAKYIAEHAEISGNTIILPDPADIIVVDMSGIPHVARDVKTVTLPWNLQDLKIYVVERGRTREDSMLMMSLELTTPISAVPLPLSTIIYRNTTNNNAAKTFCPSWYLDPVLYNLTGDESLRGFIPSGTFKAVVPLLVETYFVDTPLEIFKSSDNFHAINITLARIHIGDHIIEVILNPLINRFDGNTFGRGEIYIIVDNNTLLTLSSYSPTYVRNLGYAYLTVKSLGEMVYSQDETGNLKGPEFILIIITDNYTITVGRVAYEYDYVLDWIANSILERTGLWWEHCRPPVGAFGMWSLGGSYDYEPCFGSIPCYYSTPGSCVFYDLASLIGVNRLVVANDHVYYAGYRGSEIHTPNKVSYTGKGIRYIEARAFGGYAKIPMINTIYTLKGKEYRKCED